jgi:hypothetical protein
VKSIARRRRRGKMSRRTTGSGVSAEILAPEKVVAVVVAALAL